MGIIRSLVVVFWGTIVFSCIGVSPAVAQNSGSVTPCGAAHGTAAYPGTNGLWLVNGGGAIYDQTIYDSNLGVCWLADANLAEDIPGVSVRTMLMPYLTACNGGSTPTINPDGT